MSGHAPGPWKAWQRDADKGSNYWLIRTANEKTGLDDTIRGYCGESNARLIAAAPELLEALKNILSLYESDDGCRDLPEYKSGQSAIAKAEGKS